MAETKLMFWPQVTNKHDVQYKKYTVNLYKGAATKRPCCQHRPGGSEIKSPTCGVECCVAMVNIHVSREVLNLVSEVKLAAKTHFHK